MATPYRVKPGDNLTTIAHQHGLTWREIYNDPCNDQFRRRRANPNLIFPGDVIMIPGRASVVPLPVTPVSVLHPRPPVRRFLTEAELLRILSTADPGQGELEGILRRALRDMGPACIRTCNGPEDLARKVQRHMELRATDFLMRPGYATILRGLCELLGI